MLTAITFRRDATDPDTYPARQFRWVGLLVGHSRYSPLPMVTQFTANRLNSITQAYGGPLDLPLAPPPAGVAPWALTIPFSQPFTYVRAQGDLLLEMADGNSAAAGAWVLDAHRVAADPVATHSGVRGRTGAGETPTVDVVDLAQLSPGGNLDLSYTGFGRAYTGAIGIGLSDRSAGGVPLPFDLGVFGAPGNFLYHSWDLVLPVSIRLVGLNFFRGDAYVAVPRIDAARGAVAFAQGLVIDPTANAFGAVFTDLLRMQTTTVTGPSQTINAFGTISGRYLVDKFTLAGPVVQLSGSFQ